MLRLGGNFTIAMFTLLGCGVVFGQVRINEIMFHAAPAVPEDPGKEWVELYNAGTNGVDLNGWRFSKGIAYSFTNVNLPAHGYWVVAANVAAFQADYPGVTNVAGGWSGKLSNSGEKIELQDNLGQVADTVAYASDGDWALIREGENYPGQTAWWRGWDWTNAADGGGRSMELRHAAFSNNQGQNWSASLVAGGTPGRENSTATNDLPPMILNMQHLPAIPRFTNTVTVTAQIVDELPASVNVQLFSRVDGAATFKITPMFDDGAHGDGLANDGYYGAVLPAQADKTIVEFYVSATDAAGHQRTWPPPTDDSGTQGANALYQVDNSTYTGNQPIYRFIVTASEWNAWLNLMNIVSNGRYSEAAMNTTVVRTDGLGTQVRYHALLRNRGAGTRAAHPHNMRLNLAADQALQGIGELDFNTRTVQSQVAGNTLFSQAGLPNAYGAPVQVRVNGSNLANAQPDGSLDSYQFGSYYCFQPYSPEWAKAHWPQDPQGNIYKGVWYQDNVQLTNGAYLQWHGTNVENYRLIYGPNGPTAYSGPYSKQSNNSQDDWSDLINLCYVLNLTPDSNYLQAVEQNVNIDEWLRYFAVNSLIINMETTLATGAGDDFSLCSGVVDSRFQLINHDLDTVLGQGDTSPDYARSIFKAADIAAVSRFLKHPDIAPRYFATLKQLADTLFSPQQIGQSLDQSLGGWVPDNYVQNLKNAAEQRRTNVLNQIPLKLTVTSSLGIVSGYPRTTASTTALTGVANAIDTKTVLVNGVEAVYTPWQGAWSATGVALSPGINRIVIQTLNTNGVEFVRTNIDIWYDKGSVASAGGTIAADTTWTAAAGPYNVTSSINIPSGVTLTIEPGTTIYLGSGVNFTVANGGRLLAEGTPNAPIRFTTSPGSGVSWGGMVIDGAVSSPETRIAYAHFEGNSTTCIEVAGGTVALDHLTFGTTTHQYLALDSASFLVSHCTFPSSTAPFELVHGTGGIKSGGHGIVRDCFFGTTSGYNDIMDYTGGNRDLGQPIIQYYNNVFIGATDDILDLDGTDAWIEGNIFLHSHKNGSPDSSSAISGGNYDFGGSVGVRTSEITVIRNIFFDCDQAATAKEGNFFTFLNNTIVHTTKTGGVDTASGVVNLGDAGTAYGAGYYLEGNIIEDAESLMRNYSNSMATVTFTNNLMSLSWEGPGGGNSTNNPQLKYVPQVAETDFQDWLSAQVLWSWFSLLPGSPAHGIGPNGVDMGAVISGGASISGVPSGITAATSANLVVGPLRTGNGIPTAGFPNGSGYTSYKWRLDGGAWSAETPIATPIMLSGLANGPHYVEVTGRQDADTYQDDPELGTNAVVSRTTTWTVNTNLHRVVINELLADNRSAWHVGENTPDVVELFNPGATAMDLSGMGLTDDPANSFKFTFPPGTSLNGGEYLVLVAGTGSGPNLYTGLKLNKDGGSLSLYAAAAAGGALLDSVSYGPQLTDYSIGRLADGSWNLTVPTLGSANVAAPVGDVQQLKLNEWLAASLVRDDFVELYNGDSLPVNLGGCYLSEVPDTWPARFQVAPLSFIPAKGELVYVADGNPDNGPRHLNFSLAQEWGTLGLFARDLSLLDRIFYGPQTAEISMGRTPNGGDTLTFLNPPTPGSGNPGVTGSCTVTNLTISLMAYTQAWKYNQSNNLDGIAWYATNYNDSLWQGPGEGLLAYENNSAITPLIHTTLLNPRSSPPGLVSGHAYYFRTAVVVTNDLSGYTLTAKMRLDDCGVIYINGVEFYRPRMPSGTILNSTYGGGAVGSNTEADMDELFTIPSDWLHLGTNVIAVEVHQISSTSSDIVWGMGLDATAYITNCASAVVVLNEVMANNRSYTNSDGSVTDWVELYNPTSLPFDLSGTSLSDDPGNPRRWVFPSGAWLNASNYLVVKCDGNSPASSVNAPLMNTGFGLRGGGGAVYLYDASASLLDAVSYGSQAADFTIARLPNGTGDWNLALPTPTSGNIATVPGDAAAVRINEWAASVANGPDWFELFNPNPQPVALGGYYLTDKLSNHTKHLIAPLTFVGVGDGGYSTFIADNDPSQGADHVSFSLDAAGEAIGLFTPDAATAVDTVSFGLQGENISEGRLPDGGATRVFFTSPTPGEANWLPMTNIVINELLSHTDLPLADAIELHNTSAAPVDISGWYLSDSKNNLRKYKFPAGTVLPAGGYHVVYENQFNPQPLTSASFSFNSAQGDDAWVMAVDTNGAATGYRDWEKFGPQFNGVSFGRVQTSVGVDFVALADLSFGTAVRASSPTNQLDLFRTGLGAPNAGAWVGPVVFSEIMYHPPPIGTNDDTQNEFIELHNVTAQALPLFDPQSPTNTWRLRGVVNFNFAPNTAIPADGFLLVVGFDPATNAAALATFRGKYGTNGTLVGPWSGKLSNNGEALELLAPDHPQTTGPDIGLVPYVTIERVVYSNAAPWAVAANGTGFSLQRLNFVAYGNEPTNWLASGPNAGTSGVLDSDGDGLPDAWEDAHGLNTFANDAALDSDHDGFSNWQEYQAGTDPQNNASDLRFEGVDSASDGNDIRFIAQSGHSYTIQFSESLADGTWQKLADVAAENVSRVVHIKDSIGSGDDLRFYRLVTPALP